MTIVCDAKKQYVIGLLELRWQLSYLVIHPLPATRRSMSTRDPYGVAGFIQL